ncbi:MAG: lipid-A-disaccharide synthase [Anaerolineae bacterium]|nr:lipid-A-disaccharide synthase [Gemmatimonadaceae bacterium]
MAGTSAGSRAILFVAGETSGDLHAAAVAREIRRRAPDVDLCGIGGTRMEREGVRLTEHVSRLSVMGFAEVLRHIPRHYQLLREVTSRIRSGSAGLVILVDYPGFNMKVARAAYQANVPVLYYVAPQVWAWGANRIAKLAEYVTKAAVILPFEEALLLAGGVDATFVGHPLLDRAVSLPSLQQARQKLALPSGPPVLALFPGSRPQELAHHLAVFVASARELEQRVPGLRVVVSGAPDIRIDPSICPYPVITEDSFTVLRAADAALCKSGTTTLEAAVAGCPLVIGYKTSRWTYALARRLVKVPHIGLVNIVAERVVAPEFVQDAFLPANVASALEPLLDRSNPTRVGVCADLGEVRRKLGSPGAAVRVAEMALDLLA